MQEPLQSVIGKDEVPDELFAVEDSEDNVGLTRRTLTSKDIPYFVFSLNHLREKLDGQPAMRECTLTGIVVEPLLSLITSSPDYNKLLGCFNMYQKPQNANHGYGGR